MAFTFSHPALVLPMFGLRQKAFSLTGLVAGSLAPDMEYYLRMQKGTSYFSHDWLALLYFNLPVGIGLAMLYHSWLKRPLAHNLPPFLFKRMAPFLDPDWKGFLKRNWAKIILSVLVGAATHLAWDKVIHRQADYLYNHQHELLNLDSWKHHTVIYGWLHIGHSLLGLVVLGAVMMRLPKKTDVRQSSTWYFWPAVLLVSTFVLATRISLGSNLKTEDMLASAIAAVLLGVVAVSVWVGKQGREANR